MEQDFRFLNELFRIVSGALKLDVDKVRNYTAFLAEKLEGSGDRASADRLRKLLAETDHSLRPAGGGGVVNAMPVDAESRFPLVEISNPASDPVIPPILPDSIWDSVREFLSVARSNAQFEAEGVATSLSLLVYGPPGSGKSHLARFIASDLGLPVYTARLDGLISSYLGSTSKNIRALFEFASRRPGVLFLDEFDAIAKLRGDEQELGEIKRVVNSFIQNLDALGPQSIVLAATNHEELLDRAIWRRFSYRIELGYPGPDERRSMWEQWLRPMVLGGRDIALLTDLSDGFSGSDIREAALRMQRKRIAGKSNPTLADAFGILRNLSHGEGSERRFVAKLRQASDHEAAVTLRSRDAHLYSHATLANLLGVSKTTAYRLSLRGDQAND